MPIERVPDPEAGPADVVVDVHACGVCGSDLHAFTEGMFAAPGQVMGHEFAGEIAKVGAEVTGLTVGDRVTGVPIQPCGRCRRCAESCGHLCEVWGTRSIAFGLPGAFAERVRIPDAVAGRNVHRLPESLSCEDGALVEPLSVAVHAVRRADPLPGQQAVVLGLGTIGLHVAQVLLAQGISVLGVDRSPLRRAIAGELGVAASSCVAEVSGETEVDLVFEATGVSGLVAQAAEVVRPRGTVLVLALYESPAELDPTRWVHKEITLRGSAMVTPEDFHYAIELLSSGRAKAQPLITHRMPLAELGAAFETQRDAEHAVKVLVVRD
ncbi:zinc-dependent alcohol dehydrogenase [Saccharopolyspora halophila]